jgi:hypothetical protein
MHGWVHVIGHPDHGSYEWVAAADSEFDDGPVTVRHSDSGYGSAALALRDGLNTVLD